MLFNIPLVLAFSSLSAAHFILQWPAPSSAFDEDTEPQSPCGGSTPKVDSSSTNITVDRFAARIQVGHPTGAFVFRATTDTSPPYNFTDLTPIIDSYNQGTFCANYLSAPASFAGKAGILQVVDNSVDGILYQCAPVNFVSGANTTIGETCANYTTSIQWTNQTDNFAGSSSASAAAQSTAASSTSHSGLAAIPTMGLSNMAGVAGAVALGLMI